jgi:SagB-type dehydrogenase family enzyme
VNKHGRLFVALLLAAALTLVAGCSASAGPPTSPPPMAQPGEIALPTPRLTGDTSLEEAISNRRSVRAFTDEPVSWQDISQLLWAAQGITDSRGLRTAPSAGALYPLEVYVALPDGVYHYLPQGHVAESVSVRDARRELWEAGLQQEPLRQAPAVFVLVAVYERTEAKYGERAERYVELEAGHAAQNLLLQAVVLNLGAVPIGAFHDDQVQAALPLPPDHRPLYLIPVGHPGN